jgi:DNA-binding response OmpR family regulator
MIPHILLVDDDALLRQSLVFNLERARYRVSSAESGEDDIGLPGMDGFDTLRAFQENLNAPIIFLTARRRELDQVLGLELGADDYITKPFDIDVLLAHIKAVLRRSGRNHFLKEQQRALQVGDLSIDPFSYVVTIGDKRVDLPPREFALLHALALEAGKVVASKDLLSQVWGAEFIGEPQVLYVQIRWLREKIELDPDHPQRILTIRGVGYKLEPRSL